jgi:hypothetical protein
MLALNSSEEHYFQSLQLLDSPLSLAGSASNASL